MARNPEVLSSLLLECKRVEHSSLRRNWETGLLDVLADTGYIVRWRM